jgi:hypothetical protein
MKEGWHGDDYLILWAPEERSRVTAAYKLARALPSCSVLGLKSWDDFIVQDEASNIWTVPTVPLDLTYAKEFELPNTTQLQADERYWNKVKWYVKPLVFGGDPNHGENLIWVTHEQHAQLVAWWNEQYQVLKAQSSSGA